MPQPTENNPTPLAGALTDAANLVVKSTADLVVKSNANQLLQEQQPQASSDGSFWHHVGKSAALIAINVGEEFAVAFINGALAQHSASQGGKK